MFGNDIDFGWRAAAAGHRTIIVPQAVVFHAEAAHRGIRRTPITGRHTHYQERRAALYTLLANSPGRSLPFQVVRLAFGTLLRMVGFLLVRQVGQALDELAALVSRLLAARASCAPPGGPDAATRSSTPSRGPPACWRRGGCPTGTGSTSSATSPPPRPTRPPTSPSGAGPRSSPSPASRAAPRRGRGRRRRRSARTPGWSPGSSPTRWRSRWPLFVLLALFGAREAFGAVAGGALSPVPDAAGDWWRLHTESWHPLGQGTRRPRAGVRAAARARRDPARRQPRRRRCRRCWCSPCRSRCGARGGSCGSSAGWSTARGFAAAAARVGRGHLRADPGRQRRLGRRPVRHRRRGRAAAVAGARRARLRRPRARPPLARRLAVRRCCSRWYGVRAAAVLVRRACSPWPWSAPASRSPRALMRDRSVWGPPAAALGDGARAARAVVAARPAPRRRAAACCSTPASCR